MTEEELEAVLPEQDTFQPPEEFVSQANVSDPGVYDEFEETWPDCWERAADLLDWYSDYDEVLVDDDAPFYEWFVGGSLNACYECVDRHLPERADEAALKWEGEPGETREISYEELHREVNATAAALRELGVEEDDVVSLYMPMVPALPITMLACARIGAPHNVVFAGFSADALATRMENADSDYLVTVDGYYRRGELLDHEAKVEDALDVLGRDVTTVVWGREDRYDGDHVSFRDAVEPHGDADVEPVERDSEDMLFLMYTSGTTGTPKGVKHTTAGYLSYVAWTSHAVLDLEPEDTYWCAADIGWITGHSYIVYGPLALGTTSVMYEGAPDHPERDRLWEMVERYGVDVFYTAPTAVRAFMKWGTEHPEAHDLSSLRLLGSVGEPINPRAWKWYYRYVGGERCPIVDTWWQTETGGMMVTTLPGVCDMKPGSAGPPLPGVDARVVDAEGDEVDGGAGYLTVHRPWPGMLRTVYGDDERYVEEYWEEYSVPEEDRWVYFPEDGAKVDSDGYVTVLGRVDDVINVSGHRLGTMELESAVVGVEGVAEAAVVGAEHELKGEAVYVYVIPEDDAGDEDALRERIVAAVESDIGKFARPESVIFTPDLPKTRSGKIMRRLLEDVAGGGELGDTSTLRNPDVVEDIRDSVS
ncbi:MAG: acetate--CoA ligase [Halobacteriales archaeon]